MKKKVRTYNYVVGEKSSSSLRCFQYSRSIEQDSDHARHPFCAALVERFRLLGPSFDGGGRESIFALVLFGPVSAECLFIVVLFSEQRSENKINQH